MLTAGQVMAVGTRPSNKVHWLVVDSEQEVGVIICGDNTDSDIIIILSCCRCRTG